MVNIDRLRARPEKWLWEAMLAAEDDHVQQFVARVHQPTEE